MHISLHRAAARSQSAVLASVLALSLAFPAWAQAQAAASTTAVESEEFSPEVGQSGKDVIWVPTPQTLVYKMLDLAKVTPQDRLMDLGSGDGRTVITAAQRGLTAQGIEYNPKMAELARRNAAKAGVGDRATFVTADLFETDLSKADVITMFLLPSINEELRPKILDLKPGTRVVSNTFPMGDWEPDVSEQVTADCQTYCTALLWVVPAKVEGTWKVGDQQLELKQTFQRLTGKLGNAEITDARLNGTEITFTANGTRYTGQVNGKTMTGKATGGKAGSGNWTANRA